ncbi:hypothetical protein HPB47_007772 [Ixodes persulcatus]|uniref:Uncharacterized protein n=1 Tax=Ixodes persulcatus TaxID=34615 RepID=A0AC60P6U9_IXOPE|nr:hypothetical protein HPB47_007772 [Ixodes persulcatus]
MYHFADNFDIAESSFQACIGRILNFTNALSREVIRFLAPDEKEESGKTTEACTSTRLYHIDTDSIPQAVLVVMGACVLNNLCKTEDTLTEFLDPNVESGTEVSNPEENERDNPSHRNTGEARAVVGEPAAAASPARQLCTV